MKTTKSISIENDLWEQAGKATGDSVSLSYVISRLLEKWLSGEIDLITSIEPILSDNKENV